VRFDRVVDAADRRYRAGEGRRRHRDAGNDERANGADGKGDENGTDECAYHIAPSDGRALRVDWRSTGDTTPGTDPQTRRNGSDTQGIRRGPPGSRRRHAAHRQFVRQHAEVLEASTMPVTGQQGKSGRYGLHHVSQALVR
jgi:hypothetical protein